MELDAGTANVGGTADGVDCRAAGLVALQGNVGVDGEVLHCQVEGPTVLSETLQRENRMMVDGMTVEGFTFSSNTVECNYRFSQVPVPVDAG